VYPVIDRCTLRWVRVRLDIIYQ